MASDDRVRPPMTEEERQELRELVQDQERLLIAVAENPDLAEELEAEYLDHHRQIRSRVAPFDLPCFCAAASLMPWKYTPHPDVQHELDEMRGPLAELLSDIPAKRWRLVVYRREGDPGDLPFVDDFALAISEEKFGVLETSLDRELAAQGTDLIKSRIKMHTYPCTGQRPQQSVLMYKIEEGAGSLRVVLRVFFETAADRTIILLHGYDKGADDSPRREAREAKEACRRLRDLKAQLADPSRRDAAVATPWSS